MHKPVRFSAEIEPIVEFIEDTPPALIVEETYLRLRNGADPLTLLTAGALAVTRSSELPDIHHGGPVHPVSGVHAVWHTAQRLPGEKRFLPILQAVALDNKHIHMPNQGPYILPEIEPIDSGGAEASRAAFLSMAERGRVSEADHHFSWLLRNRPGIECLDLLLTLNNPKNLVDDHYVNFAVFTARTLDLIGWQYAPVLMRTPGRFGARRTTPVDPSEYQALIDDHHLLERPLREQTGPDETHTIGVLGEAIGQTRRFNAIPPMLAEALAGGLSLEGAGEALSIGAAALFGRSDTGNPIDVHIHTGLNLRRYLLRLDGISLQNKLFALFTWHTGPEVRIAERKLRAAPIPAAERVSALPWRGQENLLEELAECMEAQPQADMSTTMQIDQWVAPDEVEQACALAQQYLDLGYDPNALIVRLGEWVCHDDFTEMHAFKHHQSAVEEYHTTREPWRNRHLIAAVQETALAQKKRHGIWDRAKELIQV